MPKVIKIRYIAAAPSGEADNSFLDATGTAEVVA